MPKFEMVESNEEEPVIKVIGVGGGGGNAVEHMLQENIIGVDFICANTDAQALKGLNCDIKLQLGGDITKGLGAGANPVIGRDAAIEDKERIKEAIKGADMLFVTAGMGGGTGTGAAPIVAEVAQEEGILTVAVVTKPFPWEGRKRMVVAEEGIENLRQHVDSLITIPNEKLQTVLGNTTSLLDAFKAANDVLLGAVKGIAELITSPGLINVDFADVKTVMEDKGVAMMGTGYASGEDRAHQATEMAISNPLLEDVELSNATGILVNITTGIDLTIGEYDLVGSMISEFSSDSAVIVFGTAMNKDMEGEMKITVVATGIGTTVTGDIQQTSHHQNSSTTNKSYRLNNKLVDTKVKKVKDTSLTENSSDPLDTDGLEADKENYLDIPAFLRRKND